MVETFSDCAGRATLAPWKVLIWVACIDIAIPAPTKGTSKCVKSTVERGNVIAAIRFLILTHSIKGLSSICKPCLIRRTV